MQILTDAASGARGFPIAALFDSALSEGLGSASRGSRGTGARVVPAVRQPRTLCSALAVHLVHCGAPSSAWLASPTNFADGARSNKLVAHIRGLGGVHQTHAQVGDWLEVLRRRAEREVPAQRLMQAVRLICNTVPASARMGQPDAASSDAVWAVIGARTRSSVVVGRR